MLRITLLGKELYRRGYGTDAQGFAWATFYGPAMPCAICGKWIQRGWHALEHNGMPERYVCSSHIQTIEPGTAH